MQSAGWFGGPKDLSKDKELLAVIQSDNGYKYTIESKAFKSKVTIDITDRNNAISKEDRQ